MRLGWAHNHANTVDVVVIHRAVIWVLHLISTVGVMGGT